MLKPVAPADADAILPLDKLKQRIRVDHSDEDETITRMRAQAIGYVEKRSGIALSRRQFLQTDKQFCATIPLLIGPVESVDAISYLDRHGIDTDLTAADWRLGDGSVMAAAGTVWPYAIGEAGAVRVTFTAGLEDAEDEAPDLIAAVEVGVAALYANREAPDWSATNALCEQHRSPGL